MNSDSVNDPSRAPHDAWNDGPAGPPEDFISPHWRIRRRIIFTTLAFCAGVVLWVMFSGQDTRVNETLALGAFALSGAVIGAYVFGSSFDDKWRSDGRLSHERTRSLRAARKTSGE